jgi:D-3-phosphoglycerate dehydrogenase
LQIAGDVIAADLDRSALLSAVEDASVLWVRLRHRIDKEVFEHAHQLRIVATPTTGLDHIDLDTATRRGILVISLRDAGDFLKDVRATAELTVGLMLALLRHIPDAIRDVEAGHWNRDRFKGRELHCKTIGLIGYGRLGRIVGTYLRSFGAEVIATDPNGVGGEGVQMKSLRELLQLADIVSLHVNLSDETRGLLGREQLSQMRPGALLINTSRGEVIDEAALIDALQTGHIGGAALDVLASESSTGVSQLPLVAYAREHPEVIITPHIGGCTYESMEKTEVFLAQRVSEALTNLMREP